MVQRDVPEPVGRILARMADAPPSARARTIALSDVEPESVSWLWPGRVPFGKLTVLDGDPGLGKSTITLDLAARVSSGMPMPDGALGCQPSAVVLLSAEDGPADTIRPRAESAGANLSVVHLFDITDEHGGRPATIPDDLERLEAFVAQVEAKLVCVDPFMAHLSGQVDSYRDQDVRRAMARLTGLAERTGAAVIVVRHLTKGASRAIHWGGGSVGIIAAARSALLVAADPDDDARRVLAVVKANLSATVASLAYRVEGATLSTHHGLVSTSRIEWLGESAHTAADLASSDHQQAGGGSAGADAVDFLSAMLADGPCPAKEVRALAADAGIAHRTLDRAKQALGIRGQKEGRPGTRGQRWMWALPKSAEPGEVRRATNPASFGGSGALRDG